MEKQKKETTRTSNTKKTTWLNTARLAEAVINELVDEVARKTRTTRTC